MSNIAIQFCILTVRVEGTPSSAGRLVIALIDRQTGNTEIIPLTLAKSVSEKEVTLTSEGKLKFQFIGENGKKGIKTFPFAEKAIQNGYKLRLAPIIIHVPKGLLPYVIKPINDLKLVELVLSMTELPSAVNNLKELLKTLQFDGTKAEVHNITMIIKK